MNQLHLKKNALIFLNTRCAYPSYALSFWNGLYAQFGVLLYHTRLIRALTLSSLSNNNKRCLCVYLKRRTESYRYNFTLSLSFHSRAGIPQGAFLSPTLFNIFVSTFPKSDDFLTSSYADDFTISCSNSHVDQMAEAFYAHSPIIEEWTDTRGLAISPSPSLYSPLNLRNLTPILESL